MPTPEERGMKLIHPVPFVTIAEIEELECRATVDFRPDSPTIKIQGRGFPMGGLKVPTTFYEEFEGDLFDFVKAQQESRTAPRS